MLKFAGLTPDSQSPVAIKAMLILFSILHVLVCAFLVIVVLLQSGKAADLAGAFGGMGSQTAFGPRGSATVLSKATTIAAALFLLTSLSLSIIASRGAGTASSVTERAPDAAPKSAPAPAKGQQPAQQNGQPKNIQVTPVAPGGKAGAPATVPLPAEKQPGQSNPVQPQPAAPKK